ncbi:hypothetical protein VTI28DRAFT_9616 [Corynascus sepedonium]
MRPGPSIRTKASRASDILFEIVASHFPPARSRYTSVFLAQRGSESPAVAGAPSERFLQTSHCVAQFAADTLHAPTTRLDRLGLTTPSTKDINRPDRRIRVCFPGQPAARCHSGLQGGALERQWLQYHVLRVQADMGVLLDIRGSGGAVPCAKALGSRNTWSCFIRLSLFWGVGRSAG